MPRILILSCVILIIIAGCSPCLYIPSGLNMPLPEKKGDKTINITYGSDGTGFQGSYATDSHQVVIVNGCFSYPGFGQPPATATNMRIEAGYGYFNKNRKGSFYEFIGGFGYGAATGTGLTNPFDDINVAELNGHFMHLFVQSDLGWVNKNIKSGFGLRVTTIFPVGYYNIYDYRVSDHIDTKLDFVSYLVQPNYMFSIGSDKVKWNFNLGFSLPFGGNANESNIYQLLYITTGVIFKWNL